MHDQRRRALPWLTALTSSVTSLRNTPSDARGENSGNTASPPFPAKAQWALHTIPDLTAMSLSRYFISPTPGAALGKRAQKASFPKMMKGECSRHCSNTGTRQEVSPLQPCTLRSELFLVACPGQGLRASHLWDVVIVLVITFIIRNGRRVGVRARGDEILIAEFYFIMTGSVTVVFCNRAQ